MTKLNNIVNKEVKITPELILTLISCIDLTSLNATDSEYEIEQLVTTANKGFNSTFPAAICVFSNFGNFAKKQLKPNINVAVVSTCFPNGQTLQAVKFFEIETVNKLLVDEVDIVISRGDFLTKNYAKIEHEISTIRKLIPKKHLKVILETGELKSESNIRLASQIAIKSGADFIKTSTGKMAIGSTPEAVYYMCDEILNHYKNTGTKIGLKPAGGIRNLEDALIIYKIINEVLGEEWLNPKLFRIGASSLYTNLITEFNNRFN